MVRDITIEEMTKALKKCFYNNYRKMHGLPMRRWKQEYKVMKKACKQFDRKSINDNNLN